MMNNTTLFFGKLFSYLFNPLIIPLLGIGWILYLDNSAETEIMHPLMKRFILMITLVFSTFLPLVTLMLMRFFGLTEHMSLPKRQDRIMPLLLSIGYCLFGYVFFTRLPSLNPLFYLLPLGTAAVLSVAVLCTFKFQISLHLMAVGALTGTWVLAGYFLGSSYFLPVLLSVVIAACTAFGRIVLNAHKPYQVYVGYLTGFTVQYVSVLMLYRILF